MDHSIPALRMRRHGRGSRGTRWVLWLVPLALLVLFPIRPFHLSPQSPAPTLQVIFLDVGQGDAALIRTPEGRTALIDAGPGEEVVDRLMELGVEAIDLVIASHPHADHIGGMDEVLEAFPVGYYMDNGVPHTTASYRRLMEQLQASDVVYLEASLRTIQLGPVEIRVFPPSERDPEDQNNSSVVALVEYGEFRALFPGDAEVLALEQLSGQGLENATVLKAPHHGSENSVSPAFLSNLRPELVVVSCGAENQYGHPAPTVIAAFQAIGAQVLRTDQSGAVIVSGNRDGRFRVETERTFRGGLCQVFHRPKRETDRTGRINE